MSTDAAHTGMTGAPGDRRSDDLITVFDAVALNVRGGRRLDGAVGELDPLVQRLADAATPPQGNAADPFTVPESERPIGNSGP